MTHICIMNSHKPIRICMEGLILGVNTLYRLFCFFQLFPMVGKGLIELAMTKQTLLESNLICGTCTISCLHSAWLECTLLDLLAHKSNNVLCS